MDFDAVFRYTLTHWHPLAVHLPLALLPLAAAAAVGYAVRGTAVWRLAALALFLLGALASWWAVETGEALYESVEGEPTVEALIETHEAAAEWAWRVSVLSLLGFGAASAGLRRRKRGESDPFLREPLGLRLLLLLPALAAAVLVALAGHVGGLMVWGVPK